MAVIDAPGAVNACRAKRVYLRLPVQEIACQSAGGAEPSCTVIRGQEQVMPGLAVNGSMS